MKDRDEKPDVPGTQGQGKGDLEGEGSVQGGKQYDRELDEFKKTHDTEELAAEAERDLDADTGELEEAEEIARSHKQEVTRPKGANPPKGKQNKPLGGQSVPPQRPQRGTQGLPPEGTPDVGLHGEGLSEKKKESGSEGESKREAA